MDVRKIYPGGEIGISSDELNLMPNSNREGIHSLGNGIGDGANMIFSGVNAVISTGVNCVVQEGFVYLNGEMLKVDAQTVPSTLGNLYEFQKVTTNNDPDGERNFRDLTTHNVYEKNRAVVVNVASITTLSVDGNKVIDVLKGLIQVQSDWNEADSSDPAYIQNKPNVTAVLLQGKVNGIQVGSGSSVGSVEGDITGVIILNIEPSELRIRVTFSNIGTSDYHPIITLESKGVDWDLDNDVFCIVKNKTNTYFEILFRETVGNTQNLTALITVIPF